MSTCVRACVRIYFVRHNNSRDRTHTSGKIIIFNIHATFTKQFLRAHIINRNIHAETEQSTLMRGEATAHNRLFALTRFKIANNYLNRKIMRNSYSLLTVNLNILTYAYEKQWMSAHWLQNVANLQQWSRCIHTNMSTALEKWESGSEKKNPSVNNRLLNIRVLWYALKVFRIKIDDQLDYSYFHRFYFVGISTLILNLTEIKRTWLEWKFSSKCDYYSFYTGIHQIHIPIIKMIIHYQ